MIGLSSSFLKKIMFSHLCIYGILLIQGVLPMETKYYLAVETSPNNFFPINLMDLNAANTTKLEEIDAYTLNHTKEEFFELIKNANLLDVNTDMPFLIIYQEKEGIRRIPVLTKNYHFNMWEDIKNNFSNKNYRNKIYNFLNHKIEENELNKLKNSDDVDDFRNILNNLSYMLKRKLYFYLYEN